MREHDEDGLDEEKGSHDDDLFLGSDDELDAEEDEDDALHGAGMHVEDEESEF